MTDISKHNLSISRRALLGSAAAVGHNGCESGYRSVANQITCHQMCQNGHLIGTGVDANPYGMPSEYEAHVVRRNVEWLTAAQDHQ